MYYQSCPRVSKYFSHIIQLIFTPVVTGPTRISKTNTKLIDNVNTNYFVDLNITTATFKVDISDYLPVFLVNESSQAGSRKKYIFAAKRFLSSKYMKQF